MQQQTYLLFRAGLVVCCILIGRNAHVMDDFLEIFVHPLVARTIERAAVEPPLFRLLRIIRNSELESTRELNRSTVIPVGSRDVADTDIRRSAVQCDVTENAVRVSEGWMVEDVLRIHPNLEFS